MSRVTGSLLLMLLTVTRGFVVRRPTERSTSLFAASPRWSAVTSAVKKTIPLCLSDAKKAVTLWVFGSTLLARPTQTSATDGGVVARSTKSTSSSRRLKWIDIVGQNRQRTSAHDYFGNQQNNKNERSEGDGDAGGSGSALGGGGSAAGKRGSKGSLSASSSFVRDAVRSVGPSVVRIDCERDIPQMVTMFAPENFREGDTMKVSGSGFVVSSDGYILTNAHVVEGAKKTTISLSNGRSFKAAIVALDELTDLAVLKAEVTPSDARYLTIVLSVRQAPSRTWQS